MAQQDRSTLSRRYFIAGLAAWCATPAIAGAGPGGAPVMLARDAPAGIDPSGFLVSEKYDGVRALWDGRQLRFRSGLTVAAPPWFTARLPDLALDGELWLERGRFEVLSGTVRKLVPVDAEWQRLRYMVFDAPAAGVPFAERAAGLKARLLAHGAPQLVAVEQARLPDRQALQLRLDEVLQAGGEGLMLHRADAHWRPWRSDALLKLKPAQDAEARVVAHLPGQGRHAGRLGALRVRTEGGVEFLLGTGFSDAERADPPPVGSQVTFTHRGLTATGVPRFASFLRIRGGE